MGLPWGLAPHGQQVELEPGPSVAAGKAAATTSTTVPGGKRQNPPRLTRDLTFADDPLMEAQYAAFLAYTTFPKNVLAHVFFVLVAIPAFTMRNIRAPLPASSGWSCAAQRAEGLVLPSYPCDASGGMQVSCRLACATN